MIGKRGFRHGMRVLRLNAVVATFPTTTNRRLARKAAIRADRVGTRAQPFRCPHRVAKPATSIVSL